MKTKEEWAESVKATVWYDLDLTAFAAAIQRDAIEAAAQVCETSVRNMYETHPGRVASYWNDHDNGKEWAYEDAARLIRALLPTAAPKPPGET